MRQNLEAVACVHVLLFQPYVPCNGGEKDKESDGLFLPSGLVIACQAGGFS